MQSESIKAAKNVDQDRLWKRLMSMAEIGALPNGGVNRQALSNEDILARQRIIKWAKDLDFQIETDEIANLFIRLVGSNTSAPPVSTGSHLDSQPRGGKFDGAFGVIGGFEALEAIRCAGIKPKSSIELIAWTNEEGGRFQPGVMGSSLFAGDIYRMYSRYSQIANWNLEIMSMNETGIGGYKEIVFSVQGENVYKKLKYESGAHRVQRVPSTESSGRIHTSTITVAVLPEADDVDVDINDNDLRIDIFHAGGHGGQNVNKVATAVRITHLPSGIVAVCQDERSQMRNKQKAMDVIKARLLDKATREQQQSISSDRKSQVGTGERAEKIRTYNFPQDRITDHRINLTIHNMENVLNGNLDILIDPIQEKEKEMLLENPVV